MSVDSRSAECGKCGVQKEKKPFIIGVAGGTASGKTSVCSKIMEQLGQHEMDHTKRVAIISQDSFYKILNDEEKSRAFEGNYNFDHPDAFDHELLVQTFTEIKKGKMVKIPVYDFKTHSRLKGRSTTVYPVDVVLIEGILVFYYEDLVKMFDMKLFVDTDPDTRLARRVIRDTEERGRQLEQVLNQYIKYVKPAFEEFCQPTKKRADVVIPRGVTNSVAIGLIVQHIKEILSQTNTKSTEITPTTSLSNSFQQQQPLVNGYHNGDIDH